MEGVPDQYQRHAGLIKTVRMLLASAQRHPRAERRLAWRVQGFQAFNNPAQEVEAARQQGIDQW